MSCDGDRFHNEGPRQNWWKVGIIEAFCQRVVCMAKGFCCQGELSDTSKAVPFEFVLSAAFFQRCLTVDIACSTMLFDEGMES